MKEPDNLPRLKNWIKEGVSTVRVTGLSGSAQSYYFAQFLADIKTPSLIILPDRKEAERLNKELQFFMSPPDKEETPGNVRLLDFPPYDVTPLTGLSPHREVSTRRLQALYALMSDGNPVVVTSLDVIFFRILPKEALVRFIEYLEVEEEVERDHLIQRLEIGGYQRTSLVEERGDYSVRGGVIDLFSPLYPLPIRLEFWGDRLESIRQFDPLSQRSQNYQKEMILLPANEIIMDKENIKRARSMGRLPNHFEGGMGFPGQEAWLNHFYPCLDTLFNYLPQHGLIVLFDSHRKESKWKKLKKRFQEDVEKFRKEAAQKGAPFPEIEDILVPFKEIAQHCENRQRVEFNELDIGESIAQQQAIHLKGQFQLDDDLEVRLAGRGRVSMAPLAQKISKWLEIHSSVVLVSRTEQQANRLKEILGNYDVPVEHSGTKLG